VSLCLCGEFKLWKNSQIINLISPDPDITLQDNYILMKRSPLIVTLFMVLAFSSAQEYHPLVDTNSLWSTAHQYFPGWTPYSDFTKFQGEVTLDGNIYKKVWTTTDTSLANWNAAGYVREDAGKKVYFRSWDGGPDDLRYDFGADAGDTIYLFYDPMGDYFVVDSVDTYILLTGESRTRINLSCYSVGTFIGNDTWVEGMGSLFGVLQSGTCVLVGDMPQLICFKENDTLKYINDNFSDCFIITGISSHESGFAYLTIFPNPSDGKISIKVNDPSILPLNIVFYDLQGNKICEKEINGKSTIVDICSFTGTSIVFYHITGSNGFYLPGKMIVLKN